MPRPDRDAHGVSTPALLRLSASAAVMNAVVPLALCLQVALAGKMAGSSVQAAFGLVVVTCGMGTTVFSFLVDGVVAKVGTAIGARRWDEARGGCAPPVAALLCGGTATAVLLSSERRSSSSSAPTARPRAPGLLRVPRVRDTPAVRRGQYERCLGGYGRVHAATALGIARAAEVVGVAAASASADDGSDDGRRERGAMVGMGVVYAACVATRAVGVTLVACLVPDGRVRDSGYSEASAGARAGATERTAISRSRTPPTTPPTAPPTAPPTVPSTAPPMAPRSSPTWPTSRRTARPC